MSLRKIRWATGLAVLAFTGAVLAADPATPSTAPSKETREKMAVLHEQMAACLRSDKAVSECRSEMMKACQDSMGKSSCSMMSGGMMGHGGMGNGMHGQMHAPPATDQK